MVIMKIYSWNVNGIRAVHKKGALQDFITKHQPDVLCLQETKANQDQIEVNLPDYEEYWCSAERKGYSGTAIFTKETPLDVRLSLPEHIIKKYQLTDEYGNTSTEGRVITVEFEGFFITTVYTPNAKDDLSRMGVRQQWDQAFLAYIKELNQMKPVIFCGDFNVAHTELDLARPKENKGKKGFTNEERSGFNKIEEAEFIDTFRALHPEGNNYTWWSHWGATRERNVGWRIDYVMISKVLLPLLKNARIHPEVFGSDHCPVSIEISL